MADGYARASGRAACGSIILGPGMTNIARAMGQACANLVPMLVVSSVLARAHLGRGKRRLHELQDQSGLVSGVTAFSRTMMVVDALAPVLSQTAARFESEHLRSVHMELPFDVILTEDAGDSVALPPARPAPWPQAIERAAEVLRAAKGALALLRAGPSGKPDAARALAEARGAPVVPTINGKGLLPPGHPLQVGSLLPERPILDELAAAEVVLAIGTEIGKTDTPILGGDPKIGGTQIRMDIDPAQIQRRAPAEIGIVADTGAATARLADAIGTLSRDDGPDRVAALRCSALDGLDPAYRAYVRILDRIAEAFPAVIIVGDSTQPVYGGNLTCDPTRARSWFNSSTVYGTLGYGLPAALGAKVACPERHVISLLGDGGLQFTLPELATAVEPKLPVPSLLWNNRDYGEIKTYKRDRNIPGIGVDIYTPDFQWIARGFGAEATAAGSLDALLDTRGTAFRANGPTLIEVDDAIARHW